MLQRPKLLKPPEYLHVNLLCTTVHESGQKLTRCCPLVRLSICTQHESLLNLKGHVYVVVYSFVHSCQRPTRPKCPAPVVIVSATYLLTISLPNINNEAMSLYDIICI